MNGGTLKNAMSQPLTRPGMTVTATPTRMPNSMATGGLMPRLVTPMFERCAEMTEASPITKPSDRSMPAEMMTKVWPRPRSSGIAANTEIACRL